VIAAPGGVLVAPVDYEMIWIGSHATESRTGGFRDVHLSTSPVWRLVAGYLMIEAATGSGGFTVRSHGHAVAGIDVDTGRAAISGLRRATSDGPVLRGSQAGFAVVADAGTGWRIDADGTMAQTTADGAWGLTLVHGPAEIKIENRIRLLDSLRSVGGRRA
jgi:hypothetical protein